MQTQTQEGKQREGKQRERKQREGKQREDPAALDHRQPGLPLQAAARRLTHPGECSLWEVRQTAPRLSRLLALTEAGRPRLHLCRRPWSPKQQPLDPTGFT